MNLFVMITDNNYVEKTISCIESIKKSKSFCDFLVVCIDVEKENLEKIKRVDDKIEVIKDSFPSWAQKRHPRDYASGSRAFHLNKILKRILADGTYENLIYTDVDYVYHQSFDLNEVVEKYFQNHDIMLRSSISVDYNQLLPNELWRIKFYGKKSKYNVENWRINSSQIGGNAGLIFLKVNQKNFELTEEWHKKIIEKDWKFPCDQYTLLDILNRDVPKGLISWRGYPLIMYKFHHYQSSRENIDGLKAKDNMKIYYELKEFLSKNEIDYE